MIEGEMSGTCSTHGRHEKEWQRILVENLKGRYHLENLGIYRRINNTEMNLREIGWEGVDWIHLAQDRDQ
jgi:hypothetical protein